MATAFATESAPSLAAIWQRVVRPDKPTFTPEAAREILKLDFDHEARRRISELSAKSGENALSDAEREELERYVEVNDVLILLQSKARFSLTKAGLKPPRRA